MSECAFCGFPDSRHRVVDAIRERQAAGEPLEEVLHDYGWSLQRLLETEQAIAEIVKVGHDQ